MEAEVPTVRVGATPTGLTAPTPQPQGFYRPDALPAAQPTASKHWRQKHWLTLSIIITDILIKHSNFRPAVFELHTTAFSLPWP